MGACDNGVLLRDLKYPFIILVYSLHHKDVDLILLKTSIGFPKTRLFNPHTNFIPKDFSQGYSKQEACARGVRGVVYRNSAEFGPPSSELRKVMLLY